MRACSRAADGDMSARFSAAATATGGVSTTAVWPVQAAARGEFERFKTTNGFDGTAKNPQWLGEADEGPG